MSADLDEIEQLQLRMKLVRTHLDEEVDDLVHNARAAVDWRQQWRQHPWIGCAAALAAGYLVIPARRWIPADSRLLLDAAQAAASSTARSPSRRLLGELAGMALGLVAQNGIRFAARQVEQFFTARLRQAETARNDHGVPTNGHGQNPGR